MPLDALMPIITGEGEDAVLTAWFVDEGQQCVEGQMIAEAQAEKVATEVYAPAAGHVVHRVALGQPVPQGKPVCQIVASLEGKTPSAATAAAAVAPVLREHSQVIASPAAKRLARTSNTDLSSITGTGPAGRITEEDVRRAASRPVAGGLRSVIAANMRRSHSETAPVTLHSTVTLGHVPDHITATVVKAVASVLADHPHLNGRRHGEAFIPVATAHIAVAIQTDDGLVAPVVRNPASRSTEDLASAITALAERAATRSLTASDYEGGTFTVTNLGGYGIDGFTPIINLPQVAILGVGAVRKVPIVATEGAIAIGYQMVLSLTFDHAFVDGTPAARFLQELGANLAL